MVLHLSISEEAEVNLKAKAAAAGVDVEAYAATLVEQATKAPLSLKEISGPIAEDFAKSGMTEDELGDLLEEAKHQMRAEKRKRHTLFQAVKAINSPPTSSQSPLPPPST